MKARPAAKVGQRRRQPRAAADLARIRELELRLQEAEETIEAIRTGAVDAVVVDGEKGHLVHLLEGADRPYRILVEHMSQGALMVAPDGTILFSNDRFATMVGRTTAELMGHSLADYAVTAADRVVLAEALREGAAGPGRGDLSITRGDGRETPVHVSVSPLPLAGARVLCAIVTDITQQRQYEELRRTQALLHPKSRCSRLPTKHGSSRS